MTSKKYGWSLVSIQVPKYFLRKERERICTEQHEAGAATGTALPWAVCDLSCRVSLLVIITVLSLSSEMFICFQPEKC